MKIIGMSLFVLLITHNIFNRRWYGTIAKRRRVARGAIAKAINLSLFGMMLSLIVTSVIISQTVFSFLPLATSFTARQAHTLAAYGALFIVALHLGLQWSMIMALVRGRLGISDTGKMRVLVLRLLTLCIAGFGVHSIIALDVASKLTMQLPIGFSAFEVAALELLLRHLAIVGLGIFVVHTVLRVIERARGKSFQN